MNTNLTEIIFLLDRSGSMGGMEKDTIGGFNGFVDKQKGIGETLVTAILFDDKYEILWNGIDAHHAKLTPNEYYVRGSTALLDAVGKTILDVGRRLSKVKEEERPGKVIFVITTDGMENSSTEFTREKVRELIRHQQEKYSWQFIFLGANIDAAEEADSMGIDPSNAIQFEVSEQGVRNMYKMACAMVSERRSGKPGKQS